MKNNFLKNTVSVALSNGIVLLSSIISGFVIPRILGVTEYGYYQTYALYLSYTALLHFGFVDGVLLKYAGLEYNKIDKKRFNTNTRFYFLMQIVVFLILLSGSVLLKDLFAKRMLVFISFDSLFINITSYYQYVSQGTMRFKELSIRKVLQASFKVILVLVLFIVHKMNYIDNITSSYYIAGICVIDLLLMLWYMITYREISFGTGYGLSSSIKEFRELFYKGIIMTLAYQTAHLVFSLDKQFVVKLYDTDTYSIYAFAYSLIYMVTVVVNAVSLVLFPNMKQKKNEENIKAFDELLSLITIIVFAALSGFFLMKYVLAIVVPKYEYSLVYVRIVFPGLAISCAITIIVFNYYKVFNKISIYFLIGLFVLALGALFNWIAYRLFDTPEAISIASIVTLFVWLLLSQVYFIKKFGTSPIKNTLYILLLSLSFWLCTTPIINNLIGMLIYIISFGCVTYIMHRTTITKYLRKLK